MKFDNTVKMAVNEGKAIRRKDYMTRDDFIADIVRSIETVINRALESYGRWDDIPEIDALEILNVPRPLFDKLGPWWSDLEEINIGVYRYFCNTFGAGPRVYTEYDRTMPPGYRVRVDFM